MIEVQQHLDKAENCPFSVQTYRINAELQEKVEKVEKYQEELDEAKAVADDYKDLETSKEETEAQLKQAEKRHRLGKSVHNQHKNIIPFNDYKLSWKPTDMRFGMNFN